MKSKQNFLWFLLGLGSQLQVLFSLSITEIIALCWAPFLVSQEYPYLRRYGLLKFFWLTVFVFIGCFVSLAYNHAEGFRWIRGLSVTGLMICSVVVGCKMIRTDPAGFKWMFVGSTISAFLCTFVFQKATEVMIAGSNDATEIMGGTLYWIQRLDAVLRLPCYYNYLGIPTWYSFFASLFMAMYSILTSASGRSAALCLLGAAAMIVIGGRKQSSMRRIGKHFVLVCILAIVSIIVAKAGYQYAAVNGMLGEKARDKYEQQTRGGSDIIHLLISGRAASFVGFLAIADSPLFGKGYWAPDTEGYEFEFLKKYGDEEDFAFFVRREQSDAAMGIVRPTRLISAHSHITAFWLYYGIAGLLYWLYVLYVIFRYVKEDCWVVPQWFFWLAAGVPGALWAIFFSPFHSRFGLPLMIVAMLMCRAIREGRYILPYSMLREIQIANQK